MSDITVRVQLDEGAYMPTRAHAWDAGADLRTPTPFVLMPHDCCEVDTGVHVQIPVGYVGELESKSGLNFKSDIIGVGTIDSGYTGPIKVKLYNLGPNAKFFHEGEEVIQLVIYPVELCGFEQVGEIEGGERGDNGFGSTSE